MPVLGGGGFYISVNMESQKTVGITRRHNGDVYVSR